MSSGIELDLPGVAGAARRGAGAVWSLTTSDQLNANLIRFPSGRGVGEHVNGEVDVIFVGVCGTGSVVVEDKEHLLPAGVLVFVPRGSRRRTTAASEDFAYLTVHCRRGPVRLGVGEELGQAYRAREET